jgi:hypothetical protein
VGSRFLSRIGTQEPNRTYNLCDAKRHVNDFSVRYGQFMAVLLAEGAVARRWYNQRSRLPSRNSH